MPIGWAIDGANRNDVRMLIPTIEAIAAVGLLVDIDTLHLDRGYDYPVVRERLAVFGLDDLNIQRRGTKEPGKKPAGPARAALDRRGDQLVVVELRPATPQHRPPNAATDTPRSASPPRS